MTNTHPIAKIAALLLGFVFMVSIACAGSSSSEQTSNLSSTQTSLVRTSDALQAAVSQPVVTQPVVAEVTEQPAEPAETEEPPQESEPPPPPQPSAPTISASINTNCREGPSQDYEVLGYLLAGQTSEVQGRDNSNNWWYIKNPEKPNSSCWVWTETTNVTGDTSDLPVITPVPLPELPNVAFNASFVGLTTCSGDPFFYFQVRNNSEVELESLRLTIDDMTEGQTVFGPASHNAPFLGPFSECPPGRDDLLVGAVSWIGGKPDILSLPGSMMRATIKLCTEDNLDGICAVESIDFTMPFP